MDSFDTFLVERMPIVLENCLYNDFKKQNKTKQLKQYPYQFQLVQ